MNLDNVVSRDEWLAARKALLVREKEATKLNDELRAERQGLPLVRIEKDYVFDSSEGQVSLLELFGEHRQLIVQHFMFDPEWEDGCPSCSYAVDTLGPGHLPHLYSQDTAFALVSRAPVEKLERWKAKKGWTLPRRTAAPSTMISTPPTTRRAHPSNIISGIKRNSRRQAYRLT